MLLPAAVPRCAIQEERAAHRVHDACGLVVADIVLNLRLPLQHDSTAQHITTVYLN
jgi:hypothetical protein